MNEIEKRKLQESLDKIYNLIAKDSKARIDKQRPKNLKSYHLYKINSYDKLMEILEEYKSFDNYNDIQDFLARRVYYFLIAKFLEKELAKSDKITIINNDNELGEFDIEIEFKDSCNNIIKEQFDVKLTCIPKKYETEVDNLMILMGYNTQFIFDKIMNILINNACYVNSEENKIYFIIFSWSHNKSNMLKYRSNLDLLEKAVNDFIKELDYRIHKITLNDNKKTYGAIIPIATP